jgi:hypothetical protein
MNKILLLFIVSITAMMVLATPLISDSGNKPIQWFANLTTDANILHKDVFPGIDLIYSGNQQRIEATMIVNPGADPGDISLEFTGVTNLEMTEQNHAIVQTGEGTVELFPPSFFQEYNGKLYNVEGSYVTNLNNKLGVKVVSYNRSYPLKIKFNVSLAGGYGPEGTDIAIITATKTDALIVDNNNIDVADPGDVIEYTVTIQNSGNMNATDTEYDDIVDGNTTLNAGTIKTTPIARNDGYSSIGNVGITVPSASGVLVNDNDPDGTTPVLTILSFDATSVNGGTVSVAADGSFTYDPPAGYEGTDAFDYTIQDSDGNTDPAKVFINVTDVIWFIDDTGTGSNLGTLSDPYLTVASFEANNGNGGANDPGASDCIFVHSGNYTAPLTLENNQILVGQGAGATIAIICSITVPTHSNPLPTTGGTSPTLTSAGNGINLASGNTIRGLNIGNTSGTGILGTAVGTATVSEVGINGTGAGVNITTSGTLAMSFDEISSSNNAGITFSNVSGVFNVSTGTINSGSSTAVSISGNPLDLGVTLTSVSSNSANNGISINNTTGSFTVTGIGTTNGSGGTIQNTASHGISLTNTNNVSLSNMNINSSGSNGINGINVFGMNLNNVDVDGSTTRNVLVNNNTGTSTVTVTNSTFDNAGAETGLDFLGESSASITFSVTGSSFFRNNSVQLKALADDNSIIDATISNNTFEGNPGVSGNSGIDLVGFDAGSITFNVLNNIFQPFRSHPINIFSSGGGTAEGFVSFNTITGSAFGSGIRVVAQVTDFNGFDPSIIIDINNNDIDLLGFGLAGIHIEARDGSGSLTGTATIEATVTNNDVTVDGLDAAIEVYLSDINPASTPQNRVCINATGNATQASNGTFGNTDFFFGNDAISGSNSGIGRMQGWATDVINTWFTVNGNTSTTVGSPTVFSLGPISGDACGTP